jgi:serine/threonine protein kinase
MPLKSTKMSFKGTCAWMAPELLRGEKCGQKVDVYSFAVCLWELLTSEIPYQGVDVGAIIWGVGSGRLSLPIPEGTPEGFALLLQQCWNKEARHRPAFRQILMHLQILQSDTAFADTPDDSYFQTQLRWKREIRERCEEMKKEEDCARRRNDELLRRREEELHHVRDVRELYETRLAEVLQLHSELQMSLRRSQEKEYMLQVQLDGRRRSSTERKRRGHKHHHGSVSRTPRSERRRRRPSSHSKESQVLRRSAQDVKRLQEELEQSLQDVARLRLDDLTDDVSMAEA